VVHAHWWVPAGLAVPRGARSVITCHGTDVRLLDGALPFRWIGRHVLRRAGLVTVVSGALAAVIERRTGIVIPEDQVQAMPLAPGDRPVSTGGGGMVVIGRLTDQKRVDLAIRACHALRKRGAPRTLRIVGDGPARARLEALAATLGLGDLVQFTGEVAPTEVPAILATADLLLMPAQREGMGLAAAEALIQGVPVVACEDGGGLLDVVPTSGGGRIVAATAEAIADGITAIASDAGAADGAWMAGRAWQHRLAADQVAARCLGWYEHVLAA
jgi:glycosyltransferase involved in cell wall biosynthesis